MRVSQYLRVSVRVMIAGVLLTGMALGWVARSASIQRRAVLAVRRGGGSVWYDAHSANGADAGAVHASWADAIKHYLEVDYFNSVVVIQGFDPPVRIPEQGVTEGLFDHIANLDRLQMLNFHGPAVTNDRLACLTHLTELQVLWLQNTRVADAGLQSLQGLKKLRSLYIQSTLITDDGLDHLRSVPGLQSLSMHDPLISDAGLAHLRALPDLQAISLSSERVTDAGLVHLSRLHKLTSLTLRCGGITDAGLLNLRGLTSLRELEVRDAALTETGVARLESSIPGLVVVFSGPRAVAPPFSDLKLDLDLSPDILPDEECNGPGQRVQKPERSLSGSSPAGVPSRP
jgi:hypothetical protein